MSARSELVAALRKALPTWQVTGYPTVPDAVTRPTVMVWTADLEPATQVNRDRLIVTLTLWVLTGSTNPETADDDLDAALEAVLGVLHPLPWVAWTRAERGVLADTFHGFQITATAALKIGD